MPNPPTPVAPDEKLLSLADAAKTMSVSYSYLKALCAEGKIESLLIGRRRLIRQADINAFVQARRRAS